MTNVWRFAPLVPFTETLSFLTDLQMSELAESRTSARHARMVYQMRHALRDAENLEAEGVFDEHRTGIFRVPAWGEATEFAVTVPAGANVLPVGAADWRLGGEVFLSSPTRKTEVRGIAAVAPGVITLDAPTAIPVKFAVPLRRCKAMSSLTGTRVEQGLSERQVSFVTQDNLDLGAHDMVLIDDRPVINDAYETPAGIEQAMVHPVEVIDGGAGYLVNVPLRPGITYRLGVAWTDVGLAAIWRRRQFWHALRGRSAEFWLPTFAADLALVTEVAAAALTVRVKAPSWAPALLIGNVLVLDDGGPRVARKVTGVTVDGSDWIVAIAASPGRIVRAVARSSIARRMRLDSDDIVLNHIMPGRMTSAAVCVGVP